MEIEFREVNTFDLWIWIEFPTVPSPMEKEYIEEVFNSWFCLGKLGGFDAENLQVQEIGLDTSYMQYDEQIADDSMLAVMHNQSEFEYEGMWGRCWFDLGTSDAIALDILINAMRRLHQEYVPMNRLIIGGQNEDWQVEGKGYAPIYDESN